MDAALNADRLPQPRRPHGEPPSWRRTAMEHRPYRRISQSPMVARGMCCPHNDVHNSQTMKTVSPSRYPYRRTGNTLSLHLSSVCCSRNRVVFLLHGHNYSTNPTPPMGSDSRTPPIPPQCLCAGGDSSAMDGGVRCCTSASGRCRSRRRCAGSCGSARA